MPGPRVSRMKRLGAPPKTRKKTGPAAQRRELEDALHDAAQAQAMFRMLASLSSDWYWEQDAELRFVEALVPTGERRAVTVQVEVGKRRWETQGTVPVNGTWAPHQAQLAARQPFYDLILRGSGAPGHERYVKISGAPVLDRHGAFQGYRGIGTDITEEHRAAMALHAAESRNRVLAEMVEQSTDAIYARDLDGHITYWNAGAERLYGFSAAEAVGLPLRSLNLRMLSAAELAEVAARIRSGARHSFEAQRVDKSGRAIDVAVNTAPLHDAQGLHVGEVCVVRDISAAKCAARELQQAKETAEAANGAKGEFLAHMSHEIRTPLNGILGITQLVLDGSLQAEQRQLLALVMASGNALATVINDILDFSKIEAGKLDIESVEFEPFDLVPDIVRSLALPAREKGVGLSSRVAPDTPHALIGDPGRLRQVLLNLVGNALKFTDHGEVEVTLDVESREVDAVMLRVGVRDTGIGIAAHQQGRIFEAFAQADSSTTRRYGGTGLGLTISARLVELMGGRIWLESELGKGSRFHFTLRCRLAKAPPVALSAPEAQRLAGLEVQVIEDNAAAREPSEAYDGIVAALAGGAVTASPAPVTRHSLRERAPAANILLVEDNEVNRVLAATILERLGHRATLAGDGIEAVALCASQAFDLVLMDMQMPNLDGLQATAQIRGQGPAQSAVPIVALTANALHGDRERCLAAGMDDYLAKPFNMEQLAAKIERWLPVPADSPMAAG